jgi:hypothetical protein
MKKAGYYKNCEKCTKPFWCYPYNAAKRRFCSKTCSNKSTNIQQSNTKRAKAKKNTGNNIKWRYNILYQEWRNACIARDNSICQNCFVTVTNRTVAVHHPKSWFDYPDNRYDVDNGVTLCRSCHNKIHILPSRKQRSGY